MEKTCLNCQKIFQQTIARHNKAIKRGGRYTGKFCSLPCANEYMKANRIGTYSKLERLWQLGENNYQWKGEEASYVTKHKYIYRHRGQPSECEHCGTTDPEKRYEWANISGEYKRDLNDWKRLCRKCHGEFDDSYRGLRGYLKKPIRKIQSNNRSGFKNVRITKEGRFRAYITIDHKQKNIGNFDSGEEAFEAYKKKALELYGEY